MKAFQTPDPTTVRELFAALLLEQPEVVARLVAGKVSLDWLEVQGLLPFVGYVLRNVKGLPDTLAGKLCSVYYTALANTEVRQRELTAILQSFTAYHVVPVVFKGLALAYTVYPIPACRPMGDMDMWIASPDDMARAQQALEKLGFTYAPKRDRPLAIVIQTRSTMQWVKTSPDFLIELHWGAFKGQWMRYVTRVNEAEILIRTIPLILCGQQAKGLSPEDTVIQLAFHFVANHKMNFPLRGVLDLALFIKHTPVHWELLVSRARSWHVQTPVWLMLRILYILAGMPELEPVMTQLSPPPLRRFFLTRLVDVDRILTGRDLSRGVLRFIFQFLIVDHFRDAIALVIRTLWPTNDWLMARYGGKGIRIRLHHFARVLRGKV